MNIRVYGSQTRLKCSKNKNKMNFLTWCVSFAGTGWGRIPISNGSGSTQRKTELKTLLDMLDFTEKPQKPLDKTGLINFLVCLHATQEGKNSSCHQWSWRFNLTDPRWNPIMTFYKYEWKSHSQCPYKAPSGPHVKSLYTSAPTKPLRGFKLSHCIRVPLQAPSGHHVKTLELQLWP